MLYGDKINIYIDKNKDFLYKRVMEIAKSNEGKEENFRTEFAIILNENNTYDIISTLTKYNNGESIPEVTDNTAWAALSTGAYCAYGNNHSNI